MRSTPQRPVIVSAREQQVMTAATYRRTLLPLAILCLILAWLVLAQIG